MWSWLASFVTGPLLGKALDAYKAKLAAGNTTDKIAADLAGRELMVQQTEIAAQTQLRIAEIGKWYEPEHVMGYTVAIYFVKIVLWDKVLGLGSTDPLTGFAASTAASVVLYYFGKRGIENVVRIWKR